MAPQFIATILCCLALLMTLDNTNAAPVIDNCNIPSLELSECRSVVADPTEGNPLYSHSELFGATATPKDVEAFKYYCINNLMVTVIREQQFVSYQGLIPVSQYGTCELHVCTSTHQFIRNFLYLQENTKFYLSDNAHLQSNDESSG